MTTGKLVAVVALVAVLSVGGGLVYSYNRLVSLDEGVSSQWAQVENTYQRRADLVPNLVATVEGAATFERSTLTAVTEARGRLGQVHLGDGAPRAEALRSYQQAQDQLSGALSRLIAVAEAYPALSATQNFRDLQAQLEGTENRIAVERMRYNEAARAFNSARGRLPTSLVAGMFGRFSAERPYFTAQAGAHEAPKVRF